MYNIVHTSYLRSSYSSWTESRRNIPEGVKYMLNKCLKIHYFTNSHNVHIVSRLHSLLYKSLK